MDSPSLIEDDGSQERTGVVKAPILDVISTRGAGNPWGERRGTARWRLLPGASSFSFYYKRHGFLLSIIYHTSRILN